MTHRPAAIFPPPGSFWRRALPILFAAAISGCGETAPPDTTGTVSGKVTIGGALADGCEIVFESDSAGGTPFKSVMPVVGGTYIISRLPPGKYKVSVVPAGSAGEPKRTPPPGAIPEKKQIEVPKQFQSAETSGLAIDVKSGRDNKLDVTM